LTALLPTLCPPATNPIHPIRPKTPRQATNPRPWSTHVNKLMDEKSNCPEAYIVSKLCGREGDGGYSH